MRFSARASSLIIINLLVTSGYSFAAEKAVIGWVERVHIYPGDFELHAKIDTGAKTSSLNAPNMDIYKREGDDWVRFEVTNRKGISHKFDEKIVRIARIRRHGGRFQKRPVIMLRVCVGTILRETQVNLINRKNFNYQMLIGRRFMDKYVVVDPQHTFLAKPNCKQGLAK